MTASGADEASAVEAWVVEAWVVEAWVVEVGGCDSGVSAVVVINGIGVIGVMDGDTASAAGVCGVGLTGGGVTSGVGTSDVGTSDVDDVVNGTDVGVAGSDVDAGGSDVAGADHDTTGVADDVPVSDVPGTDVTDAAGWRTAGAGAGTTAGESRSAFNVGISATGASPQYGHTSSVPASTPGRCADDGSAAEDCCGTGLPGDPSLEL